MKPSTGQRRRLSEGGRGVAGEKSRRLERNHRSTQQRREPLPAGFVSICRRGTCRISTQAPLLRRNRRSAPTSQSLAMRLYDAHTTKKNTAFAVISVPHVCVAAPEAQSRFGWPGSRSATLRVERSRWMLMFLAAQLCPLWPWCEASSNRPGGTPVGTCGQWDKQSRRMKTREREPMVVVPGLTRRDKAELGLSKADQNCR